VKKPDQSQQTFYWATKVQVNLVSCRYIRIQESRTGTDCRKFYIQFICLAQLF